MHAKVFHKKFGPFELYYWRKGLFWFRFFGFGLHLMLRNSGSLEFKVLK